MQMSRKCHIAIALLLSTLVVGCAEREAGTGPGRTERVFPEELLSSWGYQTTRVGESHEIRSTKNYGDSDEAFYARFHLKKCAFESAEEAAATMDDIEAKRKSTVLGRDKDYRRILQKGEELYFVTATSNYTHLGHQPLLMRQIGQHLKDSKP